MTFANPLMLWGTTAALIPLLIHLFDRRRPRSVPFGALAFVLRSQKRTASRLRLKRLVLYLLRTLFLLAVPIALARPELSQAQAAAATHGAAATAVLVDTSFALRWKAGNKPLFDEARAQAKAALAELSPEEPATVVACTRSPQPLSPLSFERARLIALVDDVKPSFEVADLNRCLEAGARALAESPLAARRLVLVSAFAQASLHLEIPPPTAPGPKGEPVKPLVVLRDVASGEDELPNRALLEARAEPAPQAGPGAWQFTFTVKNFGKAPAKDLPLQLKVDGAAVAKGFVDLPAHGTAQKTLVHRFPQGGVFTVEGALSPDALPEDDVRTLAVSVPKVAKALLVNGSPSPQKHRDEAFFFDAALSASGSPVRALVRDADAAWHEDFSGYDVVALLNVAAPPPEVAARLEAFVTKGGGLFVSAGDRVEADAWNASLGALLPKKVRVVKTAVEPGAPDAQTRSARLAHIVTDHAVFAPFTGRAREGLLSTRFSRYLLFESDSQPGTEVLGTLDDGAPAFLTARHGKGRVFVFASTFDADWCDLPIRTGFLPLAQRLAAWLTGGLDERDEVKARVGQTVGLTPEAGVKVSAARAPSGAELVAQTVPNATQVTVGPLPEPGRYAVLDGAGKPVDALTFAATLDPAASDTSRLKLEDVGGWFGEETVRTASGSGPERKTPAWTWLLVVAALAFSFEGLLLRK